MKEDLENQEDGGGAKSRKKFFMPNPKIRSQVKLLRDHLETPFEFTKTNSRYYLDSDEMGSYMTAKDRMPMHQIHFIDKVKKYVLKNELYLDIPKVDGKKVQYFHYNPKLKVGEVFKDCYEIDLEKAYWETSNNLGLLPPEVYPLAWEKDERGDPVICRDVRLACIGSFARKRRIYTFDGETVTMRREKSPRTARIWHYVADLVSKVMFKGARASKGAFVFFWVDAVFVKTFEAKKEVERVFKAAGYGFESRKIKRIETYQTGNAKVIRIDDGKEVREFPYAVKGRVGRRL